MPEISASKWMTMAGWDDVPHLSADAKRELLESTPPYLRDARSKGIPSMGAGAIYPVEESVWLEDPFQIPTHWKRCFALDVGWNRTACVWGAVDEDSDIVHLHAEHYRGHAEPSIHATAIRARGDWIPGVIDPAARGRSQHDGSRLIQSYIDLGLNIVPAKNAVTAGIEAVWERLSTGRLKVFSTMQNWRAEQRFYRRDEKGQIVKENDHLMDATRYLVMSGLARARTKPKPTISSGLVTGDRIAGY